MSPLLVQVSQRGQLAGWLGYEQGKYHFMYAPGVGPNQAIAHTMPINQRFWQSSRLFPVFDLLLPSGARRQDLLRRLGLNDCAPALQNLHLLMNTQFNGMGSLGFVNPVSPGLKPRYALREQDLLSVHDGVSLFESLYEAYWDQGSGLAGASRKLMVSTRTAVATPNWILWRDDAVLRHERLLVWRSEWERLRARWGLGSARGPRLMPARFPRFSLSGDGQILFCERDDLDERGQRQRAESLVSLLGVSLGVDGEGGVSGGVSQLLLSRCVKAFSADPVRDLRWLEVCAHRGRLLGPG